MRVILVLALLLALAGCGEGSALDNEFRNGLREDEIATCLEADWKKAGWTQAEAKEICACATDRWMKGSTTGEVLTGGNKERYDAAMDLCAAEVDARRAEADREAGAGENSD